MSRPEVGHCPPSAVIIPRLRAPLTATSWTLHLPLGSLPLRHCSLGTQHTAYLKTGTLHRCPSSNKVVMLSPNDRCPYRKGAFGDRYALSENVTWRLEVGHPEQRCNHRQGERPGPEPSLQPSGGARSPDVGVSLPASRAVRRRICVV